MVFDLPKKFFSTHPQLPYQLPLPTKHFHTKFERDRRHVIQVLVDTKWKCLCNLHISLDRLKRLIVLTFLTKKDETILSRYTKIFIFWCTDLRFIDCFAPQGLIMSTSLLISCIDWLSALMLACLLILCKLISLCFTPSFACCLSFIDRFEFLFINQTYVHKYARVCK